MSQYDFLSKYDEEVVCWYLTIETEYGKPPYLLGSYHVAGVSTDGFTMDDLADGNSRLRHFTCGVLRPDDGVFMPWKDIDDVRRSTNRIDSLGTYLWGQ